MSNTEFSAFAHNFNTVANSIAGKFFYIEDAAGDIACDIVEGYTPDNEGNYSAKDLAEMTARELSNEDVDITYAISSDKVVRSATLALALSPTIEVKVFADGHVELSGDFDGQKFAKSVSDNIGLFDALEDNARVLFNL